LRIEHRATALAAELRAGDATAPLTWHRFGGTPAAGSEFGQRAASWLDIWVAG